MIKYLNPLQGWKKEKDKEKKKKALVPKIYYWEREVLFEGHSYRGWMEREGPPVAIAEGNLYRSVREKAFHLEGLSYSVREWNSQAASSRLRASWVLLLFWRAKIWCVWNGRAKHNLWFGHEVIISNTSTDFLFKKYHSQYIEENKMNSLWSVILFSTISWDINSEISKNGKMKMK